MLTNQDRRAILEQVKASDSGDIIAALRGQVSTEPMQNPAPTQEPINIPQSPQPVDVDLETTSALPSNLVDSTASLPTQLAKEGGVKKSHGGLHTAEPSSTYVSQNFNIPTIETPLTKLEQIQQMVANSNTSGGTISNYYDKFTGNNPNKQWISGASNQMYASGEAKEKSQDYGETILGFAAPVPFLNSMKVSASGAKIPGLIDDVLLGPVAKGYGKLKNLFKKNPLSTDLSKAKFPKYDDRSLINNTSFEEMAAGPFNPNKLSKGDKIKVSKAKLNQIKYLQSDEYASKRMANTGESLPTVKADVDTYIKEVNEAPINLEFFDNEISKMRMKGAFGQYYGAPSGEVGRMYVKRGYGTNLSDETMDVLKHEIGHAGSPAGKMKVANPDAPIPNQYDKFVSKEAYKNYPTLKIKKEITGNYMRNPAEQQVRLVRTGEWLKQNAKWDGNPNNLTDGMIRRLIKSVSKSEVPHDVEMLIRLADATPKQMKDVIGKAWAAVPVAVGAGAASEKKLGGFQDFPNMIDNEEGAPWEVKKGLRRVESSDGVNMMNSSSSATGLYGQLYNEIKDIPLLKNISRKEFAADTTLQNTILDMRWRGELQGIPGLKDNAEYLSKKYSDVNKDLTFNEIAAMSNLTGRQGAIDYFRSLRHGTEFKLPGKNKTPSQYIESYREAFKTGGKKKGADGKACWDGYRYAGTENGKDKCVPFEYGGFKKKCKYGCW